MFTWASTTNWADPSNLPTSLSRYQARPIQIQSATTRPCPVFKHSSGPNNSFPRVPSVKLHLHLHLAFRILPPSLAGEASTDAAAADRRAPFRAARDAETPQPQPTRRRSIAARPSAPLEVGGRGEMDLLLPYKIGDVAECKTYEEGFRGAWFRCKIEGMRAAESGHLECYLEYIDYPGEKKEWIRVFQKNPAFSRQQSIDHQIMIRPSFPQWYWKDQVPEQFPDNEAIAVVSETWKVGDMVDWLSEGCYWSARINKLRNEDMVEVELLQPPIGEGQCYDANRKDLRPSLDWSLIEGWTVPLSQGKGKSLGVCVIHHKPTGSETSKSGEETSSGGVISSNMSWEASGSLVPKPSSAAKSRSQTPNLGARASVTSSQPGIGNEGTEMSASEEETSPGGDKEDNDGDSHQDMQLQVIPSNTSQDDPGSLIPEPSLAANRRSQSPNHGAQPSLPSTQPGTETIVHEQGTGSSTKQGQAGNIRDQYMQKLEELEGRLKQTAARLQETRRSRAAALATVASIRCD